LVTFIRDFIATGPVNARAVNAAFTLPKTEKQLEAAKIKAEKALNARQKKATEKWQKAKQPDERKGLESVRAPLLPLPLLCPLR